MGEDLLSLVSRGLAVAGASVLELWAAIPLGFALGFHPVWTGVLSAIGSMASAFIVVLVGGPLRNWMVKRWDRKRQSGKPGKMKAIWDRYGVAGLGLVSPLITGAPLGAVIGVSFGARAGRLLVWMCVGIVVWSVILTALVHYGVAEFL